MTYHWEDLGHDTQALFAGAPPYQKLTYTGPAIIHKIGPALVPSATAVFRVTGTLFDSPLEFPTLDAATAAAEATVQAAGDSVE